MGKYLDTDGVSHFMGLVKQDTNEALIIANRATLSLQARIHNFSLQLRIGSMPDGVWPVYIRPVLLVRRYGSHQWEDGDGEPVRLKDTCIWRREQNVDLRITDNPTINGWQTLRWVNETTNAHVGLSKVLLKIGNIQMPNLDMYPFGIIFKGQKGKYTLFGFGDSYVQNAVGRNTNDLFFVRRCPKKLAIALAVNDEIPEMNNQTGYRIISNVIPLEVSLRNAIPVPSETIGDHVSSKLGAMYSNYIWDHQQTVGGTWVVGIRHFEDMVGIQGQWYNGICNHLMQVKVGT